MDGDQVAPGLTRYAALYIDVPNILFKAQGHEQVRFQLSELAWGVLVDHMLATLETERIAYVGGLYLGRKDQHSLERGVAHLSQSLGKHVGPLEVVGLTQDVDACLVIDLFTDLIELADELERKAPYVQNEVTVLLGGGDHLYAHAVKRIRGALYERTRIALHTFSWRSSLSYVLEQASDKVVLLDDIPIVK